ncbi:MAG: hypothetical protein ACJASY_001129 [Halioglobus sp.]|jgi:hypothetical protein
MYISPILVLYSIVFYLPVCLLFLYLLRKLQKRLGVENRFIQITRYSLVPLLFLVPTWEAILGKYHLDSICDGDGGMFKNGIVSVDSLYMTPPRVGNSPHSVEKWLSYGFKFIDTETAGEVYRYRVDENGIAVGEIDERGQIIGHKVTENISQYTVEHYATEPKLVGNFIRIGESGRVLKNRNTGEIVAGYRDYVFASKMDLLVAFPIRGRFVACSTVTRYRDLPRYKYDIQSFYAFIASPKLFEENLK